MGATIRSKAVKNGRNFDIAAFGDDRYIRCSRCGWINNLDRDIHSMDGGYEGWGTNMVAISSTSGGTGYSSVNQAAPVVTMSLVGSQIHGSWVWPTTLTTGVTTVQVAYTEPSPPVFTTITTNYSFLSNGVTFVGGKPWYSYSISTPAASWRGGTLLIQVLIPSSGATSPVNAGLQTQGYNGQVVYNTSQNSTDYLTNTYGNFSFYPANDSLGNLIYVNTLSTGSYGVMLLLFNSNIYYVDSGNNWYEYIGSWSSIAGDPRTGQIISQTINAVVGAGCTQCGTLLYTK